MGIEQGKEQVSRVHFSKEKPEINCLFPNPSGKLSIKARPQTLVICPKAKAHSNPKSFLPPRQQSRHGTTNRGSRGLYWGLADVMEVGGRGGIPGLGLGKGREEAKGPRSRNPALPASTLRPLPHPRFLTPASPCLWEHRAPRMDKQDPPGPQLGVGCRIQDSVCLFCPRGDLGSSMHPSPPGQSENAPSLSPEQTKLLFPVWRESSVAWASKQDLERG